MHNPRQNTFADMLCSPAYYSDGSWKDIMLHDIAFRLLAIGKVRPLGIVKPDRLVDSSIGVIPELNSKHVGSIGSIPESNRAVYHAPKNNKKKK